MDAPGWGTVLAGVVVGGLAGYVAGVVAGRGAARPCSCSSPHAKARRAEEIRSAAWVGYVGGRRDGEQVAAARGTATRLGRQ